MPELDFAGYEFNPVVKHPNPEMIPVLDLTTGYNPEKIRELIWAVGRYNEYRPDMYTASQYKDERNIHMGIDIWCPAGTPLYLFYDGTVAYKRDNNQQGNYGPTIITRHLLNEKTLYALWGHLSRPSLERVETDRELTKGSIIGYTGEEHENGGWVPHLHLQLSFNDPGEADMPGVVAPQNLKEALKTYPDPRIILGNIY